MQYKQGGNDKIRFFTKWLDPVMGLPGEDVKMLVEAISKYSFCGQLINLPLHLRIAFNYIKPEIDRQIGKEKTFLYVVEFKNKKETFIKIGVTRDTRKRFKSFSNLGYSIEILEIISCKTRESAFDLEQFIHSSLLDFSYTPLKRFGGMHECFQPRSFRKIWDAINERNQDSNSE